ncbi:unnamed protein product [Rotaria sp. Silwood2]|nr:unnamed protein product [Rotaria sp. Silwood2]
MAEKFTSSGNEDEHVEWMYESNSDPWSKSQLEQWTCYSDVENLIIEDAYSKNESHLMMDNYYIDFKRKIQISKDNENNQRPINRVVRKTDKTRVREERFTFDPIAPKRPYGHEYGWVSPFILEVRKYLKLIPEQLPSKDDSLVPMIVEKAADGIIEEGKIIGRLCEAQKLAEKLKNEKDKGMKQVWICCAKLYSMECFLYKKLNEVMRLIGSDDHEQLWRSKVRTLGPFCLLLWDNPFKTKLTTEKTLYRVVKLTNEQIATYEEMAKNPNEYRSFQAFTSSSRNKDVGNNFPTTNVLFIMEIEFAFTVDIAPFSEYPHEEEELITPGVCFTVHRVEFDKSAKKHVIHLKLRHRFSRRDKHQFQKDLTQASGPEYNTRSGRITGDLLIDGVDLRDLLDDHFSGIALDDGDDLSYDRDGNRH